MQNRNTLTLKEKLQLFKLAKKPRKQIRLRLQVITNELNLPSVQKTKQLYQSSCEKQQKVIANINNFKKIDNVKHYANSLSKTIENQRQEKQNKLLRQQKQNKFIRQEKQNRWIRQESIKTKYSFYKEGRRSESNIKKVNHPNNNSLELLKQFNFNITRAQKHRKTLNNYKQTMMHKRQSYSYFEQSRNQKSKNQKSRNYQSRNDQIQLLGLKNELSSLMNLNKIYRQQLKDAKRIQSIESNANRLSQFRSRNQYNHKFNQ